MIDCGHHCHEVGGPFIAENPDCPVHGSGGYWDREEEMRAVIRELCEVVRGYADSRSSADDELIQRALSL